MIPPNLLKPKEVLPIHKSDVSKVKSKQAKKEITLDQVLRKLETQGVIINVDRLMAQSGPALFVAKLCRCLAWLFRT
jgi:riboflavin biosynthesis pyrimidine reductase